MSFSISGRVLPVVGSLLLAHGAWAQAKNPLPSFYTTYQYTAYTVYDNTTSEPPTEVRGVGGTLTLKPSGAYEKRFSILLPSGPKYFRQDGTFTLNGDSIRFAFTDLKGADVQRGTFQYSPATQRLTLTILGYPVGNKGVYELVAADAATQPTSVPAKTKTKAKPAKKPRP
ncbi:MAG TPA: hypothetical protein VF629_11150 [Hymenobacter sp.]|jgi:hypothetical protein|uniref:hypothetical protein n=1 Tax=Hymenobacter sp. TaxID=1898978 RepID=UPI002EDB652C